MTNTARRLFLGALAIAPVAAIAGAAHATAPRSRLPNDWSELDRSDVLRMGMSAGDARFASLCRDMLAADESETRAWDLRNDANAAADALAPFPSALMMRCRYTPTTGPVQRWEEQWSPASDRMGLSLERLASLDVQAAGGDQRDRTLMRATCVRLRAQWEEWQAAHTAAKTACLVPELEAAAEAASERATQRMGAIMSYRPRSVEALRVKVLLRWDDGRAVTDGDDWRDLMTDIDAAVSQ